MTAKNAQKSTPAQGAQKSAVSERKQGAEASPWDELTLDGKGLVVHDFITTLFSHTSNGLRRAITVPYADHFELSVSEWRILSVLAHSGSLPFPDLVVQSAADKAQVSRTLQLLEKRELVQLQAPPAGRKGMVVLMTPQGRALYRKVMPVAQKSQAAMILTLSREERRVLYTVLQKLRAQCDNAEEGVRGDSRDA